VFFVPSTRYAAARAFSLVELSIVLVILGLLIGGVLAGQSLIRASELRSITTQYQRYMTATLSFRDKYFMLPGDINNAQSFWGVAHATPATCKTTASTTALTCNGDGNGKIDNSAGSVEWFRFWQHLANAGLIEGSFSGIDLSAGPTGYGATTANVPAGKISSSLWFVYDMGTQSFSSIWFDGIYNNTLAFAGVFPNYDPATPNLKPEEAWNIDTKLDDGKPATGRVVARAQNGFNLCTDVAVSSTLTANYLLTSTDKNCSLMFRNAF
jgi:prepilin-type N-terminal cleavage/methylation domain-containing protein